MPWQQIASVSFALNGIGSGTSFLLSPSAGDRYFGTDLGWLCYYAGTRWLTMHEYAVDLSAVGVTVDTYPKA